MIPVKFSTEPQGPRIWQRLGEWRGDRHQSMGTEYNQWGLGRGVQGRRTRETDGQINIRRLMPKTYIKEDV